MQNNATPFAPDLREITASESGPRFEGTLKGAFSSWGTSFTPPAGYFKHVQLAQASRFYAENGFIVLEDGLGEDEVDALNDETAQICRGKRGNIAYRSGLPGIISVAPEMTDIEVMKQYLCIHFPHKVSQKMYEALAHPSIVSVLTRVIGANVKCMQSMLFIKASGKPGQAWHQDEFFIPTRDRSLTGAWIAMDDATIENGCLWVIPGSHKLGILWPQRTHHDRRFDCTGEAIFPYSPADEVPVEVKKGSIVFFNGYLLHRSLPNYAKSGFRRSLVNHYMSAESFLPWMLPRPNERAMGTLDYRDIVMVAGKDPYAYKGIEDRAQPHLRPSGEGGCGDPKLNVAQSNLNNQSVSAVMSVDDEDDH